MVLATSRTNPAWSNAILAQYWDRLAAAVDPLWMPKVATAKGKVKLRAEEYGTGHYGVVMPTHKPGVVFKLTSDPSEARFVANAIHLGEWPDGVVHYYGVVALEATKSKRPVFALWREESQDYFTSYDECSDNIRALYDFLVAMQTVLEIPQRYLGAKVGTPARRVEVARIYQYGLRNAAVASDLTDREAVRSAIRRLASRTLAYKSGWCLAAADGLAESGVHAAATYQVAEAMLFYQSRGIYLADVHPANVGVVTTREDYDQVVVVRDPGHAIFLSEEAAARRVPPLP